MNSREKNKMERGLTNRHFAGYGHCWNNPEQDSFWGRVRSIIPTGPSIVLISMITGAFMFPL